MNRSLLVCLLLLSHGVGASALVPLPTQPADAPWPTDEWTTSPLPSGVDNARLQSALGDAFENKIPALGQTRAVAIIQGGRLVYEHYADGYTSATKLVSWSMAKSITQALVGVAVREGRIDIDTPMGNPDWRSDDARARIPWRIWLQMTDGQRYLEDFAPTVVENDALKKLFGPGRLHVAHYCAGLPLIHTPGTIWNYNSCGYVLLADALTRVIVPTPVSPEDRRATMSAWMHKDFLDVIGLGNVQPEFDATGMFYGSSSFYGTARDFAKFGLLYLRDGVWNGRRILPEGWVDFARTVGTDQNANVYGAGWWITPREGEGVPEKVSIITGSQRDAFTAIGHEGQFIVIVPSKDLIIVRLGLSGDDKETWAALYEWLGRLARTFPQIKN